MLIIGQNVKFSLPLGTHTAGGPLILSSQELQLPDIGDFFQSYTSGEPHKRVLCIVQSMPIELFLDDGTEVTIYWWEFGRWPDPHYSIRLVPTSGKIVRLSYKPTLIEGMQDVATRMFSQVTHAEAGKTHHEILSTFTVANFGVIALQCLGHRLEVHGSALSLEAIAKLDDLAAYPPERWPRELVV